MPRRATGARYFASKKGYFATVRGERILLLRGERTPENDKEADLRFHQRVITAAGESDGDRQAVAVILDAFMSDAKHRIKPSTWKTWRFLLQRFVTRFGTMQVREIKPHMVSDWLAVQRQPSGKRRGWKNGTINLCLTALRAAFRWAKSEGRITVNPAEGIKRPPAGSQAPAISEEQHAKFMEWGNVEYRDLLTLWYETGARPFSEIANAKGSDFDAKRGALVIMNAKRRKPSVVRLNGRCIAIVQRRLLKHGKDSLLFRNRMGGAITSKNAADVFGEWCKRLSVRGITPYSYRRQYATDALKRGVPIATLAVLMNTSVAMIERSYSHLIDCNAALAEAVA